MKKLFAIVFAFIVLITPMLVIFSYTGRSIDIGAMLYNLTNIPIIKSFMDLPNEFRDFSNGSGILDFIEQINEVVALAFKILVVDPLTSVIYIFRWLFGTL